MNTYLGWKIGHVLMLLAILPIVILSKAFGQNNTTDLKLLIKLDEGTAPYEKNGSMLGRKVANAGDLNGDGYDDWAIGLPDAVMYDNPEIIGKIYIYFGGTDLQNEQPPDLILMGKGKTNPLEGEYIAAAGDVNGDGYDDILVGNERDEYGKVYIYYGGASMDTTADVVLTAEALNGLFGVSISTAGDVNGDGYDDVIVGAYGNDVGGQDAGRAYIYFGGSSMDDSADVILSGEKPGDRFGKSVATAGDINGDGYADIIIGATHAGPGSATGRAYVYFGGPVFNNQPDIILTGEDSWNFFGTCVSPAGDVNNDGFDDVLVLALVHDNASTSGRVYLLYGAAKVDSIVTTEIMASGINDHFGDLAASAGDVNNDGYADIIVNSDSSRVYLFYGAKTMDSTPDVVLKGESKRDKFGYSFSPAGDINHDGYADMIVGAFLKSLGGRRAGRVYLYFGGPTMDDTADVVLTGAASLDHFAASVSDAGDVNGDGYNDLIIGAPDNSQNGWSAGCAYVFLGRSEMSKAADLVLAGRTDGDYMGTSVANAGDVNSDGYDDIIIGAPGSDATGGNSGSAYIYYGGLNADSTADVVLTGKFEHENFGYSVSSAGDVNGDGYVDVIVGAFGNGIKGENTGRAYIFYGGAAMDTSADITLTGEAAGDRFGFSVSSAGDVNGDGYDDVIVGAFLNDGGQEDAGRVYLYFGSSDMDSTADVVLTGEAQMDFFGFHVSDVGDVNGDGYADVCVGATLAGQRDNGRAYIYFGSDGMDDVADIILSPPDDVSYFGYSASFAGDVNNDSYDDVIIGAPGENSPAAFVFHGGFTMDGTADAILTGEAERDQFGASVSFAGDINHDGHNEVIVGAPRNSAAGKENGRAYVFSGSPLTAVKSTGNNSPTRFKLWQNYPNPFNSFTTIGFTAPKAGQARIDIYNSLGQKVATLFDGRVPAGYHKIEFDAEQLSSGLYWYVLKFDDITLSKKLLFVQ